MSFVVGLKDGHISSTLVKYMFSLIKTFYKRKARRMVNDAMTTFDSKALTEALNACHMYELPNNDPEVIGAQNRLEFLECKNGNCIYFRLTKHATLKIDMPCYKKMIITLDYNVVIDLSLTRLLNKFN